MFRFGVIPMFLFSGTFFPVDQLPDIIQPIAYVTPLWHGIELCRGAVISGFDAGDVAVHLAVLIAYASVGWVACRVNFGRRLRP